MKKEFFLELLIVSCIFCTSCQQAGAPAPHGPVPNENQMRWQEMEYYAFLHFSTNTFTDEEWGYGTDTDMQLFNPTELDCRQWARVCKEVGMTGIIITAKHHSGFCLWPTKTTDYSVKNSPWRDGKGDILRELADACKEYGLKLGIYVSPWDRNYPEYGRPEYITALRNQLREVLTDYGEIYEVWFDGANGGNGWYGGANETRRIDRTTYYDWSNTYKLIRELQPKIVIWNDGGDRADLRWVGTEAGYIGETNWSLLNAKGDVPYQMLHHGVEDGDVWCPGEVNTSIRPGWFYHASEDNRVKTLPQLLDVYYHSFGRNGTMLLNFPIDRRGLIHENDEKAAKELWQMVQETFSDDLAQKTNLTATSVRGNSKKFAANKTIDGKKNTYWTTDDDVKTGSITIDFGKPTTFNRFLVQEYIRLGQRVKAFTVEAFVDNKWKLLDTQTTIGYKRILRFPSVTATQLRFTITDSKACPLISKIGVYHAPQILTAPTIVRNKTGEISIIPTDNESEIYFTLDGSQPSPQSNKYNAPVPTEGKLEVRAIAYDPSSKKSSPVSQEKFDVSKKDWSLVGVDDERAYAIFDGNMRTSWTQSRDLKMPIDLVVDLGKTEKLTGFRYHPSQRGGIISHYQLFVSNDNKQWVLVNEGEFSNIQNNPVWQEKTFPQTQARYVKFRALKNTRNNDGAGYAAFDVITN
jgi:alpha-L-fucosidase